MSLSLPSQTKYVPISEAAKFLGVSLDTIRRWDKSGVLESKRLDGKNRYFSLEDLENNKSNRPLSISEVSKEFNISPTTLRRLESRGIIKPLRNKAGERIFDSAAIESFTKSDYFQRKKNTIQKVELTAKTVIPSQDKSSGLPSSSDEPIKSKQVKEGTKESSQPQLDQKPKSILANFMAISVAVFILLTTVGLGNVFLFKTQNYELLPISMVLGEKTSAVPASFDTEAKFDEPPSTIIEKVQIEERQTPFEKDLAQIQKMLNEKKQTIKSLQPGLLRLVEIATDSGSIRQSPNELSAILANTVQGEVFEFLSFNSGWVELRLHESTQSGFIQEQYTQVKDFEFSLEDGWSNSNESTNSALLEQPQGTKEEIYDQNTN